MNRRGLVAAMVALGVCVSSAEARAQGPDATREAGTHFRRGVELYNEMNYGGALVEFKRAYALVPSSFALYDIGEAQFQLQDYAGALQTFRRFLADFGPKENHRAEVEASVQLLATRVGQLRLTTVPAGVDIAIDDDFVGKTPFAEPLLVSVGHRKVVASMPGRTPATRYVDVAAGDDVPITLVLPTLTEPVPTAPSSFRQEPMRTTTVVVETPPKPRWHAPPGLLTVAWTTTGILAAGAATFGILALTEANQLQKAKGELTTGSTLTSDASLTNTYAIVADSLTAAAIVAGGFSLYWTLSSSPVDHGSGSAPGANLSLGPASVRFQMTF